MFDTDVLVVGGGPVGEMALALLGHRGVSAIGLEKELEIWPKPRAVHFDGETLRTFQNIGLGDLIAAQCFPMVNYRMENEAGEILIDIPTGQLGSQGWLEDYMFHQPHVDAALREEIEGMESVRLLPGTTVVEIISDGDSVTAVIENTSGDQQRLRARYLIGCDGASSFVRKAIGAQRESLGPSDPWLIVDGICPDVPPIEGSMVFLGHHSRPKIWAAMPGRRGRMEFKVLPSDDVEEITSPEAITRMSGGLLRPDNFVIERTAIYTFRSSMTQQWRSGRIFLAGDAAHLAPPLFGQGLCSGIRDVVNLSWKIDLVLRGASPTLLDSYESERVPHVRSWVEQATNMATLLQTTDPEIAAQRDQFIRLHPEDGVPMAPALGPGLHTAGGDGDHAGLLSPQPAIPGEQRFDDLAGSWFVLAVGSELFAGLDYQQRAVLTGSAYVHLVTDDDPGCADLLALVDANAVVVRPDRYVLGVATTAAEVAALCDRLITIVDIEAGHSADAGATRAPVGTASTTHSRA